ncbi:MAG: response regulator, partial [Lachnospiraceae bacterium]|nr:response regulator [Lachnospiraceae bacterium]
ILMDIQMPVMDGYEAARQIRLLEDPALSGIPIIAMTANAFEEDRKAAEKSGMNDFLSKPINLEEIVRVLKEVFAQK